MLNLRRGSAILQDQKPRSDTSLKSRLDHLSAQSPDYWSFRGNAKRDHGHGLMQYPAMMVPQMVRALLAAVCETEPGVRRIADPFVGSGTVLTETTLRGLDFVGNDINPLAVLLCRVKAGPIYPEAMTERAEACLSRVMNARSDAVDLRFPGRDKWFTASAQVGLSRIRRAIQGEDGIVVRRFLWVALAETVRLTSNSRTSTFKLHIRSTNERKGRRPDPIAIFTRVVRDNLKRYASLGHSLRKDGLLARGHYTRDVALHLGDSRTNLTSHVEAGSCDVVLTSPPYGDNVTTVPYGQYSFLPLNWIDLSDIGDDVDPDCLSSTHEIDRRSLGGSRRLNQQRVESLRDVSSSLAKAVDNLTGMPSDRWQRVAAFASDLEACVAPTLRVVRPGGLLFWVLGNRRVGGNAVPLDQILCEFLEARSCSFVTQICRQIPSKRMAARNSVATTMANETILVVRKGMTT